MGTGNGGSSAAQDDGAHTRGEQRPGFRGGFGGTQRWGQRRCAAGQHGENRRAHTPEPINGCLGPRRVKQMPLSGDWDIRAGMALRVIADRAYGAVTGVTGLGTAGLRRAYGFESHMATMADTKHSPRGAGRQRKQCSQKSERDSAPGTTPRRHSRLFLHRFGTLKVCTHTPRLTMMYFPKRLPYFAKFPTRRHVGEKGTAIRGFQENLE